MVGNDVVDLGDPEVREDALHPRFDERVFAPEERAALSKGADRNRLRWTLWAAKEAAYKTARKLDPAVIFSPARFVVRLDAGRRGVVRHADRAYPVRVRQAADWLHAVAADDEVALSRAVCVARVSAAPDASAMVRALVRRRMAAYFDAEPGDLRVERRERIPRLLVRGEPRDCDLSLSHHGRLVAFACELGQVA